MKKICFAIFALSPSLALAGTQNNWSPYLRADAGVTYSDVTVMNYDISGFQGMFNFSVGAQKEKVRLELALQERATVSEMFSSLLNETVATLEQRALMINGYYDVWSSKYFAWYLGAGAGVNNYEAIISYNNTNTEVTEKGYSAMLGAYTGISINFNYIGFDIGVDYYYTFKPSINSLVPKVGLRVMF